MFSEYVLHEWVGVRPELAFTGDVESAVLQSLREELEGQIDETVGIIILVSGVEIEGDGILLPNDPKIYFPVKYRILAFEPILKEVDKGIVRETREFGLFVNLGPTDGLVHRNQIMDDDVEYIQEARIFKGQETNRTVGVGDAVRVRVTQVSRISKRLAALRIALTMRQPYLGKEEWYNKARQVSTDQGADSA